ncbi:hypothetical protein JY96_08530 [Aquabacterium sp. NJ1]|uniref:DsbA family oxidoreductase n=1 Tax=Aquabacterium sp. NJ1 TaxID=1538295 RepID=UPI00052C9E24|nr:DsbA family oxidoreductase [Aquabacterium sp. NJ1]KGM40066.1 hypothetical protein JY96_08530 [Aquabacterium sp. NJ1]
MRTLTIDASVDLICPWCMIGKQHLTQALAQLRQTDPDVSVRVRWHGLQLLPDLPPEGQPFMDFYVNRLGSPEAVARRQAQVQAAGDVVGQAFAFERIATMPNTRLAHEMVRNAATVYGADCGDALIDALMQAYFMHGQDIGQRSTLVALAQGMGLDMLVVPGHASAARASRTMPPNAPGLVSRGVPHFVFNQRAAIEGASHHSVLLEAMHAVLRPASATVHQA